MIITALISHVNKTRPIEDYIAYGKKLLEIDIPQITFIEREIYNLYFCVDEPILEFTYEGKEYEYSKQGNKTFVFFEKSDIYLYDYEVTNFHVITDNPVKDTLDYMMIQCHKTEWLKMASQLEKHERYIWVDFGIRYVFRCSDDEFVNIVESLHDKTYENIRIGTIWDLNSLYKFDILRDISWYFAGGVFGGNKDKLLHFANIMKDKCLQIIDQQKTIMWEVNIWYLIYLENKELFDTFHCGHDDTIITNY
jgi:hypothetical protein